MPYNLNPTMTSLQTMMKRIEKEVAELQAENTEQITVEDNIVDWVQNHRIIKNIETGKMEKFSFKGREYLIPVYLDTSQRILFVKSRQLEITEFAVNYLIYNLLKTPIVAVYTCPRHDQITKFSKDRFRKALRESNLLDTLALGDSGRKSAAVGRIAFGNGSVLYCVSAWGDFDALRGIPANLAVVDEFQSTQPEALPVLEEAMSRQGANKKLIVIGTPKYAGTDYEKIWLDSDMKEWDKKEKKWIPTQESKNGYSSYHIVQRMAYWITEEDFKTRRQTYGEEKYMNEVEGLFYAGAAVPYLPQDIANLFKPWPMLSGAEGFSTWLGVDWGSGRAAYTVATVLAQNPETKAIEAIYIERMQDSDLSAQMIKISQLVQRFKPQLALVDAGYGAMQLQELQKKWGSLVLPVYYVRRPDLPIKIATTVYGTTVEVDRTYILDRVQNDLIRTKNNPLIIRKGNLNFDWFVDGFTSQKIEVKEMSTGKTYRDWVHIGKPDDCVHSLAYAYLAMIQCGSTPMQADMLTDTKFLETSSNLPHDFQNTPYFAEMQRPLRY